MKSNSVSRAGGGGAEGVKETTRTEHENEETPKPTLVTTPTATKSLEPTRRSSRTVRRSSKVSVTPSPPTYNGKRKTQDQAKNPKVKTSNKMRLIHEEKLKTTTQSKAKNPDVVFGRGGVANAYRQNSLYHALLAEKWKTYSDLGRNEHKLIEQKQSKRTFAKAQVIDVILQAGGNFFIIGADGVKRRMDPKKDMPEIIRKVMQALRDCRTKRVPGQPMAVSINSDAEDKYADDDDDNDDNNDDDDAHDDEGMANDGTEKSDNSQSEKEEEDDNDDDGGDEDNDEDALLTVDELVAKKKKSARAVLLQGFQLGLDVIFGQGGLYNQLRKESLYKGLVQRCSKEFKPLKVYKEKRQLAMEKIMSVIIQAGGRFWIGTDGGMKLLDHTKSDVQNTILIKIIQAFRDRLRGKTAKQAKAGVVKKKKAKAIAKTSVPSVKPPEESPTSQTIQSRKVASSPVKNPSRPLLDQHTPTRTHKNRMTFPKKLYNMLSGGMVNKLIDWSKDGKYILIIQPNELVEALPQFMLDQSTIRSFHRQLSIWGFTRISALKGKNVRTERWQHPMFYRGMPFENFSSIVRGGSSTNRKVVPAQTSSPSQKRKNAPSGIADSSERSKRVKMSTEPKKKKANSKIRASARKPPSHESSRAFVSSKTVTKASVSSKTVTKASISSKTVTKASVSSKTVTNDVSYQQWLRTYLPPTPSVARGIHKSGAFLLSATPPAPTPTPPTKQQDKEENEEGFWAFPHVVPLPYTLPPASRPPLPSAVTGMFDDAPDDPTLHWYHHEFKVEESPSTNIPNASTIPAVQG